MFDPARGEPLVNHVGLLEKQLPGSHRRTDNGDNSQQCRPVESPLHAGNKGIMHDGSERGMRNKRQWDHQKAEIVMLAGIIIPFTPFGTSIGLQALPLTYFPWLIATLLAYYGLTQLVKVWYLKHINTWL